METLDTKCTIISQKVEKLLKEEFNKVFVT